MRILRLNFKGVLSQEKYFPVEDQNTIHFTANASGEINIPGSSFGTGQDRMVFHTLAMIHTPDGNKIPFHLTKIPFNMASLSGFDGKQKPVRYELQLHEPDMNLENRLIRFHDNEGQRLRFHQAWSYADQSGNPTLNPDGSIKKVSFGELGKGIYHFDPTATGYEFLDTKEFQSKDGQIKVWYTGSELIEHIKPDPDKLYASLTIPVINTTLYYNWYPGTVADAQYRDLSNARRFHNTNIILKKTQ